METAAMKQIIGICRETRAPREKRTALPPDLVGKLVFEDHIKVIVQPSPNRIFTDDAYRSVGARISEDLSSCNIIFGIKEIEQQHLIPGKTYCFFSHTIKGQKYNMPMLRHILDNKINLLDYELVTNEAGKRQVFFGDFAGYAGMINTLWAYGQRTAWEGFKTPFADLLQSRDYHSLTAAREAITRVGHLIAARGLPPELGPVIIGVTGKGQVARGALDIARLLPVKEVSPEEILRLRESGDYNPKAVYLCQLLRKDQVEPKGGGEFDRQDYARNPGDYQSKLWRLAPHLSMLVNGIYWDPRFPILYGKAHIKAQFEAGTPFHLKVIGDITCDIEGSIEMTLRGSTSLDPLYVYDPLQEAISDGFAGPGVVMMTVDKLPGELPVEASRFFGNSLLPYLPDLAAADFSAPQADLKLHPDFSKAIIAYQGKLTPNFQHLADKL